MVLGLGRLVAMDQVLGGTRPARYSPLLVAREASLLLVVVAMQVVAARGRVAMERVAVPLLTLLLVVPVLLGLNPLPVESGVVGLLEHLLLLLLVAIVTLVVHLGEGGRVVAWQQLELGNDADVVAREVRVGATRDAVLVEPSLVQTAQYSQALELSVRVEDVVDYTLEIVGYVGVAQLLHFFIVARFELERVSDYLRIHILLVAVGAGVQRVLEDRQALAVFDVPEVGVAR